jgi:hypothetical protein
MLSARFFNEGRDEAQRLMAEITIDAQGLGDSLRQAIAKTGLSEINHC